MRYSTSLYVLAAPLAAFAAPMRRSASAADILVFQFADVLEQLETNFYSAGIAKFQAADFTAAGFTSASLVTQQLINIQSDEATHSSVLQAAIQSFGASPITTCTFDFDSALSDVATMAATARALEVVGVSAYLGGATLLDDPVLLDDAGSILSVEARHSTILNILSGTGTAVAQPFDIPLTPQEVLAIGSNFISGCDVGITANPSLAITNTGTPVAGTALTFSSSAINGSTSGLFCQMMVGGAPFSISLPFDQCIVPQGINGVVYIWVTSDDNPLANNVRDRATDKQIAGPTIAFIDSETDVISQVTRTSSVATSDESTTTETISPDQASAIIASAQETATATSSASSSSGTQSADSSSGDVGNAAAAGPALSSTPNLATGPNANGSINVNGWTNLPTGTTR